MMNPTNESKIQLFKQQNQLNKQLKTKKDMIAQVRRSYYKNKKIAQEQMELIKQLTEMQKKYYEVISTPPPIYDSKISQYHQYRHLINDLDNSYRKTEEDSELAFPFDEDITSNIDQYSDLYSQIDDWLQKKENSIEEGEEQKNIRKEIEKLKEQNLQLRNLIEEEPDVSEQIIEIKSVIKEKKALLRSRDDIITLYQQKQKELDYINNSILESQQRNTQESNDHSESDEANDIKIDKDVNVQALNKLQSKTLKKWEELRQCQIEYQNQEVKWNNFIGYIKNVLKT